MSWSNPRSTLENFCCSWYIWGDGTAFNVDLRFEAAGTDVVDDAEIDARGEEIALKGDEVCVDRRW